MPIPLKDDCTFTGWYTDSSLTQAFFSDTPITENMTLYASYADRDYNYKEYVDSVKFLPDCEDDITFEILSPEPIDDGNLDKYITIKDKVNGDEIPDVTVTSRGGNVYAVSPRAPYTYTPGDTYELSLIDTNLSFYNEKQEVRTIAFSIKKPETYDVKFKDGIVYLLWSQVNVIGSGVYSLPKALADDKGIAVGTTICLTDELDANGQGVLNENSKIRNILSIVNTDSTDPQRVMLFTEASSVEDVYKQLDVYVQQSVDPEKIARSIDLKKLERDVKNSEGTMKFTRLLAVALNESQTVAALFSSKDAAGSAETLLSGYSSPFAKPTENNDKLSITANALVSGLTVTASVGTARNTNFPGAVDNNWVVLTIKFNYNATIKKVQVKADFTFKEFITLSEGTKAGLNLEQGIYFDAWIDAYSQTDVEFNVLVKTVDVDEEYLDITAEIQKLIDGFTKDNSDVPEIIREVLGSKGDYIDLVEVNIFEESQDVKMPTPVLQFKEKGDFVVRLNLAVGLSAQSTIMSASRIGIRGGTSQDLETYRYGLEGDGRQSLDLYCAGYLGVKAGVRLTVSVNFYGLESLGRVGFTGEAGAYMDLYGFLQLHLVKAGGNPDINMNGGVYMEVGIYFELKIFAESKYFNVKAELSVLDKKLPFYTLGNRYVLYRFKNAGKSVIINQNDCYISNSGLLDCEMLDLTTGQVVKGDYSKLSKFYFKISNPWMIDWLDENHIQVRPQYFGKTYYNVYVAAGTKRLDATVQVYYGGDNLCFSSREKGYTYNEIKLIWIDPSIDPKTVNLSPVTATYVVNMDGEKVGETKKLVLAGTVPGGIDLSAWTNPIEGLLRYQEAEVTGYTGDWNEAIWKDATYVVNMTKKQVLISYIYLHNGQWHYEVYAAENGDTPPVPSGYQSPGPGRTFKDWMRKDYTYINYSYPATSSEPLTNLKIYSAWACNLTVTGYDKTQPVYTFTGTLEECNEKFNENQKTMPVMFHNMAEYDTARVNITFYYPRMQYTAYGQKFNIMYLSEGYLFNYGTTPLPPRQKSYPGCTILGWSHRYVNAADYAYDRLPLATQDTYYNLIVEFKQRRIIFKTDMGAFADGSTEADSGMIPYSDYLKYVEDFQNANNALTIQPVQKDGALYKFHRWDVDYSQDEQGIQTWNAVWVVAPGQEFTAAFNAGEGAAFSDGSTSVSLGVTYGTRLDLASFTPVKAADNQYTYTLAGWKDQDGKTYGPTDTVVIQKHMTYTAVYTPAERMYTVTVSAGNGKFPDGTDTKTFTGKYGEDTNISGSISDPTPPGGNSDYHYEFDGWSEALPEIFTQDMTITAKYRQVENEYTVTFDAGSGCFEGGSAVITQTYHYGAVIIPPDDPTKAENEYFRYEFTGWSPPLNAGDAVTGNRTYTANYRSVPKGSTLPEAGITVTNGEVTEDISVGSISGYTYEMVETFDGTTVPVLTITGDGLTFSGTGSDVYVNIDGATNSVTFDNLNISVSKEYFDSINVGESSSPLTVNIRGNCAFEITLSSDEAQHVMRIERPTRFAGTEKTEDSLRIVTSGGKAIYASNSLTFDTLDLAIDAAGGEDIDMGSIYALSADVGEGKQSVCRFVYSDVAIASDGGGFMLGPIGLEIQNSVLGMNCDGSAGILGGFAVDASNVTIAAGQGLWIDGDAAFSGASQIKLTADGGAAISAVSGITVPDDYDLGGASIRLLTDSSTGDYYTFAIETEGVWIPAANVQIHSP
ncbi:InlB B-repeat-containing protein [Syntrophomonas palmitatica]|uniref:InlB B-repeat-containing protein n=1 Tax=Syntrophomonas palmitatica TaxID=402877 RepID=UPI0006D116A1|nr:InlB B-repeat-containing protein [Syntrophomonas palmitatica]